MKGYFTTMDKIVKITKKDRFESIIALCEAVDADDVDLDGIIQFCKDEIATLDKRAASAKVRAAEKRAANDEFLEVVYGALTEAPQTREEILKALDNDELTLNKVGARLTKLVNAERVVKEEISVEGADGKKHKVMTYRLA